MLDNEHMPDSRGDDARSLLDRSPLGEVRAAVSAVIGDDDALAELRRSSHAQEMLPVVEGARREVEGLRRREQELSALFSSARELAGVRDADALLHRLVLRAHEMLGADVTYLSEFDPQTRSLHVRATHGAVSASFRELVVPPGAGLVSVVVETGAPQAASRYEDYAADRHAAEVDDAVAAEGIVSMLGVPLRAEQTVLGVLFVAMRQERVFPPEQIALLSALADHASVVLQAADTLRSLQRSEEEARATLEELSEHLRERDRASTVHQQLVSAVLAGGGFSLIAETLATTFTRAVRIVDERGDERATAGDTAALTEDDAQLADAKEDSQRSGHAAIVTTPAGRRAVVALTAGSRRFGAVQVEAGAYDLGAVDLRTLERAAQVGALLALSEEAVAQAQERQQLDLVADLVRAASARRADVIARTRRAGFDPDALDVLLLVSAPGDRRAEVARMLARSLGGAGLVGELDGVVVVVADGARSSIDAASARRAVGPESVVVSSSGTGGIGERYDLARRALRLLRALEVDDAAVSADELLPYAVALDADAPAVSAYLDAALGPVRAYDAARGTELLVTLRAFVRHGGSPSRTARALTFHPNTILQRLDRLDRLLGDDWRADERFFRLSLAVRLDELRERLTRR
jgi:hypothetical protein